MTLCVKVSVSPSTLEAGFVTEADVEASTTTLSSSLPRNRLVLSNATTRIARLVSNISDHPPGHSPSTCFDCETR